MSHLRQNNRYIDGERLYIKFDTGWLYLSAGCVLLGAAIVLPPTQELDSLQERLSIIQHEHETMAYQIDQFQIFYDALSAREPELIKRVVHMQTNGDAKGDFVVFDPNAAKTPLEWLKRSTTQPLTIVSTPDKDSMLEILTAGDQRLWVAGFGGLVLFVGLVHGVRRDQ